MKKNYLVTASLAGVLVFLVLWYALYEKHYKQTWKQAEEKTKLLTTLERNDIHELVIERRKPVEEGATKTPAPAPEVIKLKRVENDWHLTEPVQAQADSGAVNGMLSTLTTTKQERTVDEKPTDLGQYGLEPALVKVQIRKDSQSPFQEIRLGKDTPVGYSTYASGATGPEVFKVAQSMKSAFDKPVKELRDRRVLAINRNDIQEVEIQSPGKSVALKRAEKDQWILPQENLPASKDEVNKIVNAITDLRATDFASDDGKGRAKFGLEPAKYRVVLTTGPDKKRTLLAIGTQGGKSYAAVEGKPAVFEIEKDFGTKLEKPAKELRSRELATFNRFNINRVRLDRGKDSVELQKVDKGWSIPADAGFAVDEAKVDGLLTRLQDAKLVDYAPSGSKVATPALVIQLFQKDDRADKPSVRLAFSQPMGKRVMVERDGLAAAFYLDLKTFEELPTTKQALMKVPEKKADEHKTKDASQEKRS